VNRKVWQLAFVASLTVMALSVTVVMAKEPDLQGEISSRPPAIAQEATQYTYNTVITVTSGTDPSTNNSETCYTGTGTDQSPCTLRRAIAEARGLSGGDRPVLISFDIPEDPAEGYNGVLDVWKIALAGTTAHALRDVYGETIVDGGTQSGGRDNGPKIIIDGQGNKNYGFILRNGDNMILGVAMQNFNTAHISVSSDGNAVEDSWFGLSDNGMLLSAGDQTTPEGGAGVALAAGSDDNVIQNNRFAGFFGTAAAIRGDRNAFTGNWVGMRRDGTVPIPSQFDKHPCLHGAWIGGIGITVSGNNNQIGGPTEAEGNVFAGLFTDTTDESPVMDVSQSGQGTIIQNNRIGLDAQNDVVGVCGRGLDFGNGPQAMRVISNTLVETGLSAIFMNSTSLNGNLLRGNVITRTTPWPGPQGFNDFSEDALTYGPQVPDELRTFRPAQVTEIDNTTVHGTSGSGSPCSNCIIELFLDDNDGITETLQSLALVTADSQGDWTASLPAPLEVGQGLRTMSTVPDTFTIIGLDPETTSKLSELYLGGYQVFLPLTLRSQ
jgi:hypothetical protein